MSSSLMIVTDSIDGKHFEITIEKNEDNTASIQLKTWSSSLDHRRDDPSKDDVLKLYDICFDQSRRLICKADMQGSSPTITCMLNGPMPEAKPYVRTVVADTFASLADGTTDYAMEKADYDELKQFLIAAGLPKIQPSVIRNEKAQIRD